MSEISADKKRIADETLSGIYATLATFRNNLWPEDEKALRRAADIIASLKT